MPGSGLGGFTEGLWRSIAAGRKEAQEREATAAEREAKILSTLANSDDPEIASMALAGMLEQASPKRKAKGMRGFLGEMEASATLPKIRELLNTPVQSQVTTPGLPSRGIPQAVTLRGGPPAPSGGQGRVDAAMAGMAPPQAAQQGVGAPPPTGLPAVLPQSQLGRGEPPPAPQSAFSEQRGTPEVGRVDTVSRPRQAFLSPQERQLEGKRRALKAAGASDQEIETALLADVGGRYALYGPGGTRGGGTLARADIIPDPQSPTGYSRPLYDKSTGQIMGSLPAMDPTRTRAGGGIDRGDPAELAAGAMGFANSEAVPRERYGELIQTAQQIAKEFNYERGVGAGQARGEAPMTKDQALGHTRGMQGTWFRLQQPVIATERALATMDAGMAAVDRGDLAAGGEAVLVTFEKILDALSVVRESEYLRPLFNQSLFDRAKGAWDRLSVGGPGMTALQLKSYAKLAHEIADNVKEMVGPARQMLRQTATAYQLDPDLITGPETPQGTQTGTPPPSGGASTSAATAAPKPTTLATVRAYATLHKISEAQAIAKAEADGFTITDKPQ